MMEQFSRTEALLGKGAMERLTNARVAVFGIGGVGGYCVEALARSGVGTLALFDHDTVSLTNLNRQILATHSVIGQPKVEVAKARIAAINPDARVLCYPVFYTPETAEQFDFTQFDYIVDAIDTVTGKLCLIQQAMAAGTPVISCMGTGNKLDPTALQVTDISKTTTAQEGKRSFAAYTQKARLTADLEEDQPEKLLYTVSTGSPEVIDAYVEETLQKMEEETMDGSAWRAEEGYYTSDDGEYRYLLVWGTRASGARGSFFSMGSSFPSGGFSLSTFARRKISSGPSMQLMINTTRRMSAISASMPLSLRIFASAKPPWLQKQSNTRRPRARRATSR